MKYQLNGKTLTDHYQMNLAEIERKISGGDEFYMTITNKRTQLVTTYLYLSYSEDNVDMQYWGTLFMKQHTAAIVKCASSSPLHRCFHGFERYITPVMEGSPSVDSLPWYADKDGNLLRDLANGVHK